MLVEGLCLQKLPTIEADRRLERAHSNLLNGMILLKFVSTLNFTTDLRGKKSHDLSPSYLFTYTFIKPRINLQ